MNEVWDSRDVTPEAALDRFTTLTGWARALTAQGANVLVCQRFSADAVVVRDGIPFHCIADGDRPRPSSWFGGAPRMRAVAASFNPAVVHVNGMNYPRSIRRFRRAVSSSTAVAVQDHGGFDPRALSPARRFWFRHGLHAATVLLVSTAALATEFREAGLVPRHVVVRDVMEGSTDLRAAETRHPPTGTLNVLWVGRLNANKSPLTVFEGFARFVAGGHDARLTFVYGTAEFEGPLRDAVRRSGLESKVTFAGAVPHESLARFYTDADLFVLGSRREGSGCAALEAMACGVIPILTAIPSFQGLTDDGRVGALWKPGDAQSLADALTRVAAAPLDSQRAAARDRFERCFSWKAIGERAMRIYRDCSGR